MNDARTTTVSAPTPGPTSTGLICAACRKATGVHIDTAPDRLMSFTCATCHHFWVSETKPYARPFLRRAMELVKQGALPDAAIARALREHRRKVH
jgi:hypothetical protein